MKRNQIRNCLYMILILLCICFLSISTAEDVPANVTDLTLSTETIAEVTAGQLTWFRFVPGKTAVYSFYSSASDGDTFGYMYTEITDGELQQTAIDDDGGEGSNFQIKQMLTEGTVYYFGVRYYGGDKSGSFPVMIEEYCGLIANPDGPASISADAGETVELAVEATSSKGNVTYQWVLVEEPEFWTEIEGQTAATFSIAVPAGQNKYLCYITDGISTEQIVFNVFGDNHFTASANGEASFTVMPNGSATMEVSASSDSGDITYQWYLVRCDKGGFSREQKLDGANSSTYTAENITGSCDYMCEVKNGTETTYVSFPVEVHAPITIMPVDSDQINVDFGGTTTMEVTASSAAEALSYQWFYKKTSSNDTLSIEGATGPSYTAENIQEQTIFSCVVSNEYGDTQEQDFVIQINGDYSFSLINNDIQTEPGDSFELVFLPDPAEDSYSYQWYGPVTEIREPIQPIEGETGDTLQITNASAAGYYLCKVTNSIGIEKNAWFHVQLNNNLSITDPELDIDAQAGSGTTLSVGATATDGELSYQWYIQDEDHYDFENAQKIEGAGNATYFVSNPQKEYYKYYCLVSDIYGNTVTATRCVYFTGEFFAEAENGEYSKTVGAGESATFTVNASGDGTITYQWCYCPYSNGTWGEYQEIPGATEASCTFENVQERMNIYCNVFSAFGSTRLEFSLLFDNQLNAYNDLYENYAEKDSSATLKVVASCNSGTISYQWYRRIYDKYGHCADYPISGATEDTYTTDGITGKEYYACMVSDGYMNACTCEFVVLLDNHLTVTIPGETESSKSIYVAPGEAADMQVEVSATNMEGITYQWQKLDENGYWQEIDGATQDTLTAQVTEYSQYRCYVQDQYGNAGDAYFNVSVENNLTVTISGETGNTKNMSVGFGEEATLQVAVSAINTAGITYHWYTWNEADDEWQAFSDASGDTLAVTIDANVQFECIVQDAYDNYEYAYFYINVETDPNPSAVTLEATIGLNEDGTLPVNQYVTFRLITEDDDDILSAELFDGTKWSQMYRSGIVNKWQSTMSFPLDGTYTIQARVNLAGSTEPVLTNIIEVTVTKEGQTGPFTYSAIMADDVNGNKTIIRGDFLPVTYIASEHATRYWTGIEQYNEDVGAWVTVSELGYLHIEEAELPQAGEMAGRMMVGTSALIPGVYRMYAAADAHGYIRTETERTEFTVVQPENTEGVYIRVVDIDGNDLNGGTIQTGDNQAFASAYAPGAISIEIRMNYNEQYGGGFGGPGECISGGLSYPYTGTKQIVAMAWYADGSYMLSDPVMITVEAEYGELQIPIPDLPETLMPGTDLTVAAMMPEVGLDSIGLNIYAEDTTGYLVSVPISDYEWITTGIRETVRWADLEEAGIGNGWKLVVMISGGKARYSVTPLELRIPIIEGTAESITLTVNGESDSVTIPVNESYSVRVTAPEEATAICVYDHNGTKHYQAGNTFEADGWICDEAKIVTLKARYTTETGWDLDNPNFQLSYLDYSMYAASEVSVTFAETAVPKTVSLAVTDAAGNDLNGGTIQTGSGQALASAYAPGATSIEIRMNYNVQYGGGFGGPGESISGSLSYPNTGTKQIVAIARYSDGSYVFSEPVWITVEAEYGELQIPIPDLPETLTPGTDLTVAAMMPEIGLDDMGLDIYAEDISGQSADFSISDYEQFENGTRATVRWADLEDAGIGKGWTLVVRVFGGKARYSVTPLELRIPITESFTLTVNGESDSVTIPVNESYSVRVTAPEEATAICVYDHNGTKHYQAGNTFEADGWICDEAKEATLTACYTTEDGWDLEDPNFQLAYLDYSQHQSNGVTVTFTDSIQPAGEVFFEFTRDDWDGSHGLLLITGNGTIPDNAQARWADYADEIDQIVIGEGVTGIGANAFANLPNTIRVDFNETTAPTISSTAFSGTNAIFRYYTDNDSWPTGDNWIYLPVDNQDEGYQNISYSEAGWGLVTGSETVLMSAKQAKEETYRLRGIELFSMPSDDEFEDICCEWDVVYNIAFCEGCSGSKTLNIPINRYRTSVDCYSDDMNLTVNSACRMQVVSIDGGTVNINGDMDYMILRTQPEEQSATVTVNGNIKTLNLEGEQKWDAFKGTLTLNGTIENGYVYSNANITIPNVPVPVPFENIPIMNLSIDTEGESLTLISNGVLTGEGTTLDPQELYYFSYLLEGDQWAVTLRAKDDLDLSMPAAVYLAPYKADFDENDIEYGERTDVTIRNATKAIELDGQIYELMVWGSTVTTNGPVLMLDESDSYHVTINNDVGYLYVREDSDSTITLGASGRVGTGFWYRRLRGVACFDSVSGPRDLYSNGQLHVLSWKDGQAIGAIYPSDDEVTAAAGLTGGTRATANLEDSSEEDLSNAEQEALEQYLNVNGGVVTNVFSATITTYSEDGNGNIIEGAGITNLSAPVSFEVSNETGGEGCIVRLHEDADGTVTAAQVSDITGGSTIEFSSELFSKYAMVRTYSESFQEPEVTVEYYLSDNSVLISFSWVDGADYHEISVYQTDGAKIYSSIWQEETHQASKCLFHVNVVQGEQNRLLDAGEYYAEIVLKGEGYRNTVFRKGFMVFASLPDFAAFSLPEGTTIVEEEAFAGIAAKAAKIPDECTVIGDRAFDNSALEDILIPPSVSNIGSDAFPPRARIFTPKGTCAEQWAKDNGYQVFLVITGD